MSDHFSALLVLRQMLHKRGGRVHVLEAAAGLRFRFNHALHAAIFRFLPREAARGQGHLVVAEVGLPIERTQYSSP